MKEIVIQLVGVDPIDILGVNNHKLGVIKKKHPLLKILSRGTQIKLSGKKEEVKDVEEKITTLIKLIERNGSHLSDHYFSEIFDVEEITTQEELYKQKKIVDLSEEDIILYGHQGKHIKPRTPNQKKIVEAIEKNDIVFVIGPAGTGKTYTAVAMAVKALKNKTVKKIILTRPAVEAGESLGFLPGDLKEKIDPYLRPLYDALDDMLPTEKINYFMANRIIEVAPLAYMRGRTLDNAFILLDEAQNATDNQLKMFLTRMGPQAKAIITGDITQIDLPKNQKSGLIKSTAILKNIPGIAHIFLDGEDVVRHKLIKHILKAYDKE